MNNLQWLGLCHKTKPIYLFAHYSYSIGLNAQKQILKNNHTENIKINVQRMQFSNF